MTTLDHSGIAAIAAISTADMPLPVKAAVIAALALSHIPLDLLPHKHLGSYRSLRRLTPEFASEVFGGAVLLPLVVWMATGINPAWLMICVVAANLVDVCVAVGINSIAKFNFWLHKWEWGYDPISLWRMEFWQTGIVQTSLFLLLMVSPGRFR